VSRATAEPTFETTVTALQEKKKRRASPGWFSSIFFSCLTGCRSPRWLCLPGGRRPYIWSRLAFGRPVAAVN